MDICKTCGISHMGTHACRVNDIRLNLAGKTIKSYQDELNQLRAKVAELTDSMRHESLAMAICNERLQAQLDAIYSLPAVGHVTSSPNMYGANIIDGLQDGIYLFALPPRGEV